MCQEKKVLEVRARWDEKEEVLVFFRSRNKFFLEGSWLLTRECKNFEQIFYHTYKVVCSFSIDAIASL